MELNTNTVKCALPRNPGKLFMLVVIMIYLSCPTTTFAQWTVNSNIKNETGIQTSVAYTSNDEGYTLEIYKDSSSAIRSRFTLNDKLVKFKDDNCPTYQVDQGTPANLSVNGAPCLSNGSWAEYILGNIDGEKITSATLLSIMNGITMTFRFQLENGDYRETAISLSGSKRSMTMVIGETIIVRAR